MVTLEMEYVNVMKGGLGLIAIFIQLVLRIVVIEESVLEEFVSVEVAILEIIASTHTAKTTVMRKENATYKLENVNVSLAI
jgi:hypothetical protein